MRAVTEAVVVLAAESERFTVETSAQLVCQSGEKGFANYYGRKAVYVARLLAGLTRGRLGAKFSLAVQQQMSAPLLDETDLERS
jgi:hypothetical protein